MAQTKDGKKKVYVKPHQKNVGGNNVNVKRHYRSTPNK